ncbi:MAG: tetratricopeptide repeat protein, partial [Polyangiaceae bacterium]|nr:tetratricopeptide repeat protein [Polyangiaceae bacterium]
MLKTGGENLDARLLRFRTEPATEDAIKLAEHLLASARASDALEVASAHLVRSPGDALALVAAGRASMAMGDLLRAQQALMQAAKLAPDDKAPFRWLGEVLLKRGDPARAVKVLEKAKSTGGSDREVDALLARATRFARLAADEGSTG